VSDAAPSHVSGMLGRVTHWPDPREAGDWRDRLEGDLVADVAHLDDALGVRLREEAYVRALIDPRGHTFQRLEYVGDALLDAVLLQQLVLLEPWTESSLAIVNGEQQALVSDHALGRVAARRGLPEVRSFQVSRHRLADRIEACIGAAWADAGLAAAEEVAARLVVTPGLDDLPRVATPPDGDGDDRFEAAARVCGHDVVRPSWFGAAAHAGPARRRLAVVGNALLETACSTAQYVDDPLATEAQMSEERRVATSNAVLAERAQELGLVASDDPDDRRAVADEVQALVGAVTMDAGIAAGLTVAASVLGRTYAPGPVPPTPH
jgi:dsRNA-specific ribonuclease